MNLVVDIGNTLFKAAFFKNKSLKLFVSGKTVKDLINNKQFISLLKKTESVIYSNVSKQNIQELLKLLPKKARCFAVEKNIKLPITINYQNKKTLGTDRIASAVGALSKYKGHLLVIDIGSCIKYNIISDKREFLGGAISPGLQMRFNALHQFTGKLPLLKLTKHKVPVLGKDTKSNLQSGVINGCISEINYFIDIFEQQYRKRLTIVVTGGDASFFIKHIKRKVFLQPRLIILGLNEILNYQLEK